MPKQIIFFVILLVASAAKAQQLPESWYRSQAAFEKGEYSLALEWNDSCITIKPKNYQYWVSRGEILFNLERYNDAIVSSLKGEKLKQGSASLTLAKSYCKLGDITSSISWLKVYLGLGEKIPEGRLKLDPAFISIEQSKGWKDLWLKDWYSPLEKLVADVEYAIENSHYEEALDLLNPRLKGGRPRPQLLALRAESYFGLGSFHNAIDDYSFAIKRSKKISSYLEGRALAYMALEKYGTAINDLTKAIELSGGKPKYYRSRAEAYYKNKQFDLAFDDIKYYYSFYPSDSEETFLLAKIAVEAGYYVDALFCLNKLIKSNPKEVKYYYYRGIAYLKTSNYRVAESDFNLVIDKEYNLSEVYKYRALALIGLGMIENACTDLENALKHGNFSAQELLYKHCKKPIPMQKW